MHAITKYVANDGSEWATPEAAYTRDLLDARVRAIEDLLGPRVEQGRRQINPVVVTSAKQ